MTFNELDTVVLTRDHAEAGLKSGDLGAVVHIHATTEVEVEFVTASGRTQALLTLHSDELRAVGDNDLLSVRSATTRGAA